MDNAVNAINSVNQKVDNGINENNKYSGNDRQFDYRETMFENYDKQLLGAYRDIQNRTNETKNRYNADMVDPSQTGNLNLNLPKYDEYLSRVISDIDKYLDNGDTSDNKLLKDLKTGAIVIGTVSGALLATGILAPLYIITTIALAIAIAVLGSADDHNNSTIPRHIMDNARRFADESHHECILAPDGSGKSKDSWRVDHLRNYYDAGSKSGNLYGVKQMMDTLIGAIPNTPEWKNLVNTNNDYVNRLNQNAKNIEENIRQLNIRYDNIIKDKNLIDSLANDVNNLNNIEKQNINSLIAMMQKDKDDHDKKIAYYNDLIDKLNEDTTKLVPVKERLNSVLIDNQHNKQEIDKYNAFAQNHINVNNQQINYLNEKKTVNRDISIQNYEELYKSVILQNEILDNTLKQTDNQLLQGNRGSEFYNKKNTFMEPILQYLYIFYYCLFVCLILFYVFFERKMSYSMVSFSLLVVLLYPYLIMYFEVFIMNLWNFVISIMTGSIFQYKSML